MGAIGEVKLIYIIVALQSIVKLELDALNEVILDVYRLNLDMEKRAFQIYFKSIQYLNGLFWVNYECNSEL